MSQNNNTPTLADSENTNKLPSIMEWSIKTRQHASMFMDMGMAAMLLLGLIAIANGTYEVYILNLSEKDQSVFLSLHAGLVWTIMTIYLWKLVVRQKKIYHYKINRTFGTLESQLHFPRIANYIFKSISALFLIAIIGACIYDPSLLILLAGPAGMAIISAKFFLGWKNETHTETSSNWDKYKFVTVDRKKNIIVAHQTNLMVGFEARLPDTLFDEYLKTLHAILPRDAIFSEEEWKW